MLYLFSYTYNISLILTDINQLTLANTTYLNCINILVLNSNGFTKPLFTDFVQTRV